MFRGLIAKMEAAALKRCTLVCPKCGTSSPEMARSSHEVVSCPKCGAKASAYEWVNAGRSGIRVGDADSPPKDTRITREKGADGGVEWYIPASGNSGGLMFFGVLWTGFIALFTVVAVAGSDESKSGWPALLGLLAFLSIFWAVGIGMFYAGCRAKFAKHRLIVGNGSVILKREFFRMHEKSLPLDTIKTISQAEFYRKNYTPVYGLEIKGDRGKLRFGSMLDDAEKAWLVADLRRVVFGEVETLQPGETHPSMRQDYFSVSLPKAGFPGYGVGFVGIGILGAVVVQLVPEVGGTPASVVSWIALMMVIVGLAVLLSFNRKRHEETRIEGTADDVAIRTMRQGRVIQERIFPRAEVSVIRAIESGTVNNRPRKRVELIVGERAELVARWLDGEKADALVEEVRRVL